MTREEQDEHQVIIHSSFRMPPECHGVSSRSARQTSSVEYDSIVFYNATTTTTTTTTSAVGDENDSASTPPTDHRNLDRDMNRCVGFHDVLHSSNVSCIGTAIPRDPSDTTVPTSQTPMLFHPVHDGHRYTSQAKSMILLKYEWLSLSSCQLDMPSKYLKRSVGMGDEDPSGRNAADNVCHQEDDCIASIPIQVYPETILFSSFGYEDGVDANHSLDSMSTVNLTFGVDRVLEQFQYHQLHHVEDHMEKNSSVVDSIRKKESEGGLSSFNDMIPNPYRNTFTFHPPLPTQNSKHRQPILHKVSYPKSPATLITIHILQSFNEKQKIENEISSILAVCVCLIGVTIIGFVYLIKYLYVVYQEDCHHREKLERLVVESAGTVERKDGEDKEGAKGTTKGSDIKIDDSNWKRLYPDMGSFTSKFRDLMDQLSSLQAYVEYYGLIITRMSSAFQFCGQRLWGMGCRLKVISATNVIKPGMLKDRCKRWSKFVKLRGDNTTMMNSGVLKDCFMKLSNFVMKVRSAAFRSNLKQEVVERVLAVALHLWGMTSRLKEASVTNMIKLQALKDCFKGLKVVQIVRSATVPCRANRREVGRVLAVDPHQCQQAIHCKLDDDCKSLSRPPSEVEVGVPILEEHMPREQKTRDSVPGEHGMKSLPLAASEIEDTETRTEQTMLSKEEEGNRSAPQSVDDKSDDNQDANPSTINEATTSKSLSVPSEMQLSTSKQTHAIHNKNGVGQNGIARQAIESRQKNITPSKNHSLKNSEASDKQQNCKGELDKHELHAKKSTTYTSPSGINEVPTSKTSKVSSIIDKFQSVKKVSPPSVSKVSVSPRSMQSKKLQSSKNVTPSSGSKARSNPLHLEFNKAQTCKNVMLSPDDFVKPRRLEDEYPIFMPKLKVEKLPSHSALRKVEVNESQTGKIVTPSPVAKSDTQTYRLNGDPMLVPALETNKTSFRDGSGALKAERCQRSKDVLPLFDSKSILNDRSPMGTKALNSKSDSPSGDSSASDLRVQIEVSSKALASLESPLCEASSNTDSKREGQTMKRKIWSPIPKKTNTNGFADELQSLLNSKLKVNKGTTKQLSFTDELSRKVKEKAPCSDEA